MTVVYAGGRYVDATADISEKAALVSGDSGATYKATVPSTEYWEVLGAIGTITTTATVGNRTYALQVRDSSNNVFYTTANSSNLAASQTAATRSFLQGGSGLLATGIVVPAGCHVAVVDTAAIDTSNDTVAIKLIVKRRYHAE